MDQVKTTTCKGSVGRLGRLALAAAAALLFGCGGGAAAGGGAKGPGGEGSGTAGGGADGGKKAVKSTEAEGKFNSALKSLTDTDKTDSWSEGQCTSIAQRFLDSAEAEGKAFPEAHYNAGLAYQRCGKEKEARDQFKAAMGLNSKFHRARVQLALYAFKDSGEKNFDAAMAELAQAIRDAEYQNVEALVNLAMLQMRRNSPTADGEGENDFARAKRNIQRALAIDDGYMPAFNQLALYYFEQAKMKAGRGKSRARIGAAREKQVDTQALELAALVCSQAIRKNAKYAPIHNTAGMIAVELRNLNAAVQSFNTARRIDPRFFEAHMNYAAVNLQFRGFQQAEEAYRAALKMRPSDYEARLGLALAIRGQIDDSNFDKALKAVQEELDQAKRIAPDRPEAYYNEAIFTQEYKSQAGGGGAAAEKTLLSAKSLFQVFIQKAGASPDYADAVKNANERMKEIDQIIAFNKETEASRKAAEEEMKQRAAEQEAAGGKEGEQPKKEGEGAAPPPADKK